MYNREDDLKIGLNSSLIRIFSLPGKDYFTTLTVDQLVQLKRILSDINNVITLRLSLSFANWISAKFELSDDEIANIRNSILGTKPNANGYDIDINAPINITAEVKCNIPINDGCKYGSSQKKGIEKDLKGLKYGKKKAPLRDSAFRFLALYDHRGVREATVDLVKNIEPELRNSVKFIEAANIKNLDKDRIYIVFLSLE